MTGFFDVQQALNRTLGDNSAGNHGAFWRGVTRDEFVELSVFGMSVVEIGDPAASNIIHALRGQAPFGADLTPPTPGGFIPRMPAYLPPAAEADIALIEGWIADGCPEQAADTMGGLAASAATDDDHVAYWREIDLFFLPALASPETREHVGRWHSPGFVAWARTHLTTPPGPDWEDLKSDAQSWASFEYVRLHQRRILDEFYNGSVADIYDSLWKFGADLLPRDASSHALPEHRMNGIGDWFIWVAYLQASLEAPDMSDLDLTLARGWQIGIAGDGLIRRDAERPTPIPIPEFDPTDTDLQAKVTAHYNGFGVEELKASMLARAKTNFGIS